jgi:endonuclease YncB( thermonuclease family)
MILLCAAFAAAFIVFPLTSPSVSVAYAHGGGLDAKGCHNDRKRGGYHCHRSQQTYQEPRPKPQSLYPNCAAARAAGATPLYRGQPGYRTALDRDGDGIACEGSNTVERSTAPVVIIQPQPVKSPIVTSPALTAPITGMAQVLDGDTIQIGTVRIRLYGIDAFEAEQQCSDTGGKSYGCGGRATRALSEKITSETVVCVPKGTDVYSRTLAVCRVSATDLSSWMVRNGYALAYTKYALDYLPDEEVAKGEQAGAWLGSFELPWVFRTTRPSGAAEAQRSAVAPSASCTIKGNVNRSGERIYHMPSDPYYARTKPENWFCSESEAQAAGFRRAGGG